MLPAPAYAYDDKYRDSIEYRDTFALYLSWKKFQVSPIPTVVKYYFPTRPRATVNDRLAHSTCRVGLYPFIGHTCY